MYISDELLKVELLLKIFKSLSRNFFAHKQKLRMHKFNSLDLN